MPQGPSSPCWPPLGLFHELGRSPKFKVTKVIQIIIQASLTDGEPNSSPCRDIHLTYRHLLQTGKLRSAEVSYSQLGLVYFGQKTEGWEELLSCSHSVMLLLTLTSSSLIKLLFMLNSPDTHKPTWEVTALGGLNW